MIVTTKKTCETTRSSYDEPTASLTCVGDPEGDAEGEGVIVAILRAF